MIPLIHRQVAWIQAAFGLYPHPQDQVQPFQEEGWRGFRDRSFPEEQVKVILKAFLSRDPALSVFHESRHRTTYQVRPDTQGGTAIFLKHYRCRTLSLFNPRTYLRLGHARKAFRLSYQISTQGIPTVKVLFYLRETHTGLRADCLLATEALSEAVDLKSWIGERYPKLSLPEKQTFVRELASFLAKLHRNGIFHGDLESNTLVVPGLPPFYLIDLDSILTLGALLKRDRKKQLRRLERRLPAIEADARILQLFYQTYSAEHG